MIVSSLLPRFRLGVFFTVFLHHPCIVASLVPSRSATSFTETPVSVKLARFGHLRFAAPVHGELQNRLNSGAF
jgi:hypothetical protein